jgi:hypothetical protein
MKPGLLIGWIGAGFAAAVTSCSNSVVDACMDACDALSDCPGVQSGDCAASCERADELLAETDCYDDAAAAYDCLASADTCSSKELQASCGEEAFDVFGCLVTYCAENQGAEICKGLPSLGPSKKYTDDDDDDGSEALCSPGAQIFCLCAGGSPGTKTCASDGNSFGPCTDEKGICPEPIPSGGAGGATSTTAATGGTGGAGAGGASSSASAGGS